MKIEQILAELEELAEKSGVKVRYDKGDFEGGYCVIKKDKVILINKRLAPPRRATLLALGMAEIGIDEMYLKPAVRDFIEDEIARSRG